MAYPEMPRFPALGADVVSWAQLRHEQGAKGVGAVLRQAESALRRAMREIEQLPVAPALAAREPDDLVAIRALRPKGPRRLWERLPAAFNEKLEGAFLCRMIGCTLGAPVEGWSVEAMQAHARRTGTAFPPTSYWKAVADPEALRYQKSRQAEYTEDGMKAVPADDDIVYTILGLLILEEYGPEFTTADVGAAWVKYLPMACTAEHVALENLKKGVRAERAALRANPYVEWIGADIRSDPWAYAAPGWPEKAAEMAWRDAFLSHRRNGLYGAMFFAAAQAAAFAVSDPVEALEIGLSEIPSQCRLARDVRWALRRAGAVRDYQQARVAVDERFRGMSAVHTNNNACLTVFGLTIGGKDVTKVLSETVAMGLDNDCTAATAGSIVGAIGGPGAIAPHWTKGFNDTVISYLKGRPKYRISSLLRRFAKQARRIAAE